MDDESDESAQSAHPPKTRTRRESIIIVGDRVIGLTAKREAMIGQLTPEVIERENVLLDVEPIENVNKLRKIDVLARLPNSDDVFLVTVQNRVYHFDLWGTMTSFEELPETVKQINSVEFNRVRSVLATTEGLFEVDIRRCRTWCEPQPCRVRSCISRSARRSPWRGTWRIRWSSASTPRWRLWRRRRTTKVCVC